MNSSIDVSSIGRSESSTMQVFADPDGRRRARLRRGLCAGLVLGMLVLWSTAWQLARTRWCDGTEAPSSPRVMYLLPLDRRAEVIDAWLDTLAIAGRHAAFRVSGSDALAEPVRLKRLVDEGHTVVAAGFSGRPLDELSPRRAEWEIAATQLTLAGLLGAHASWVDCGGDRIGSVLASRLRARGVHCVSPHTDGSSWSEPTSAAAATLTLSALLRQPSVVADTDAASPSYTLATPGRALGAGWCVLLESLDGLLQAATVFAMLLFGVFLLRFVWVAHAMLRRARLQRTVSPPCDERLPALTVIVPAYNEEKVIVATVRSVLACDYPLPVQVIVVDDGSSDRTLAEARSAFEGHPQVTVLTQRNGGKSAALNRGVDVARTSIVVCIDADTQLDREALRWLCRHFEDPLVGAVAGNPKVGNRCNLLTRVQALEYVVVDSVERQALEGANAITCITGALGAYRRELLQRLGGHLDDTLAEDTDMTLRLLRSGTRVVYEERAVAWTEAPETLRDFMRQRFRWMFGTVQAAFKYRDSLFRVRDGSFGMVAMPHLLLLQVGAGCLLLPMIDMLGLLSMMWLLVGRWISWLFPHFGAWLHWLDVHDAWLYTPIALLMLAAFWMAGVALRLDRHERMRSLVWLLPAQIVLRVLLGITAYRCIGRMLSGRMLNWGALQRTGHVSANALMASAAREAIP